MQLHAAIDHRELQIGGPVRRHRGRRRVELARELQLAGKLDAATASMATNWTTDLQFTVIDRCVQLHGGYGRLVYRSPSPQD
ncbi:hypothetical protein CF640_36590 [Burkholderia pseudomallei]|nr:hypothetical protein CF640_36590 [Burkholderia pseudomallei]